MRVPLTFIRAAIDPRWFVAKNQVVPPLVSASLPPGTETYNFGHWPLIFSVMHQKRTLWAGPAAGERANGEVGTPKCEVKSANCEGGCT